MSIHKGEHGSCETVRIKGVPSEGNPDGVVVINKSDYDPEKHELHGVEKKDDGKGGKSKKDEGSKDPAGKEGSKDDGKGGK